MKNMKVTGVQLYDLAVSYVKNDRELRNSVFFEVTKKTNLDKIAKELNISVEKLESDFNFLIFENEEETWECYEKILPLVSNVVCFTYGEVYMEQ